jgi:hypothetical protein
VNFSCLVGGPVRSYRSFACPAQKPFIVTTRTRQMHRAEAFESLEDPAIARLYPSLGT